MAFQLLCMIFVMLSSRASVASTIGGGGGSAGGRQQHSMIHRNKQPSWLQAAVHFSQAGCQFKGIQLHRMKTPANMRITTCGDCNRFQGTCSAGRQGPAAAQPLLPKDTLQDNLALSPNSALPSQKCVMAHAAQCHSSAVVQRRQSIRSTPSQVRAQRCCQCPYATPHHMRTKVKHPASGPVTSGASHRA